MFARLVIALNIILAVLWTCLVIIPAAIKYKPSHISSYNETKMRAEDPFHVRNLFDGRVCVICKSYIIVQLSIYDGAHSIIVSYNERLQIVWGQNLDNGFKEILVVNFLQLVSDAIPK